MKDKLPEVTDEFWNQEIDSFNREITGEFLQQAHLSPQTLKQYRSALRQFFSWVYSNSKNKQITDLKPRDALRFQNFLIDRDLSSSAIKFKRSAVSSLCGYIEVYYNDEFPLFRNIYSKSIPNPPKNTRHEKNPLTKDEFNHLINTLEEKQEWQMLAYVVFSYETGARRAEVRQLLKEVVSQDYVKGKNYYLTHPIRAKGKGKEGKVRKMPFADHAMHCLKKWLQERGSDDCEYVFVNKKKSGKASQIALATFNYWCTDIFSKIVGRRVHPHMFRSTRATHLIVEEGKNLESAQKLLGHESSDTTRIYVVKEDDEIDDVFS